MNMWVWCRRASALELTLAGGQDLSVEPVDAAALPYLSLGAAETVRARH